VDERTRRVGANEALFRRTNVEIEHLADEVEDALALPTEAFVMVCECGDLACTDRMDVPRPVYERARADAAHFIVKPGHQAADLEHIVEEADDYLVVRKEQGAPAALAERTDPRSPST